MKEITFDEMHEVKKDKEPIKKRTLCSVLFLVLGCSEKASPIMVAICIEKDDERNNI
jgi:hypothetical protein